MNKIFAIALVGALSATAPALAQSTGYFGAPSGHNTPGGGVDQGQPYSNGWNNGYGNDGYYNNGYDNGQFGYGDRRNDVDGYGAGYGNGYDQFDRVPGGNSFGVPNPSGAIEGRAAANDEDEAPAPRHRHRHRMTDDDTEMTR